MKKSSPEGTAAKKPPLDRVNKPVALSMKPKPAAAAVGSLAAEPAVVPLSSPQHAYGSALEAAAAAASAMVKEKVKSLAASRAAAPLAGRGELVAGVSSNSDQICFGTKVALTNQGQWKFLSISFKCCEQRVNAVLHSPRLSTGCSSSSIVPPFIPPAHQLL